MWRTSFFRRLKSGCAGRVAMPSHPRRSFVPRLEILEDRTVPSTLTVLNNLDRGEGSLRDAIKDASSGDTIVFAPSLNGQTITLTSHQLAINKSLDIEGPGASRLAISGNDTDRVFNIHKGLTVTIAGLTITHGRGSGRVNTNGGVSPGGGGGILMVGSTLALASDVFASNVDLGDPHGAQGGALTTFGSGSVTVTDSTFIGNRADGRVNNGQFVEGGAIFSSRDGPSIMGIRCTFTGNQAIGADGGVLQRSQYSVGAASAGAIHIEGASTLTVIDSTFIGNQARAGSGGTAPKGSSQGVYNVDSADGGAIVSHDGGTLVISGSMFANNQAIGGSNASGASEPLAFIGASAGGGVASEGPGNITNCTFLGNEARGGSRDTSASGLIYLGFGAGGGLANLPFGLATPLTVSNCTFANNRAIGGTGDSGGVLAGEGFGGGFANFSAGTATVTGSTFTGNSATGGAGGAGQNGADGLGGAIANLQGSSLTVSSCTLSGNYTIGGAGGSGANGGNGFGGGLYNDGTSTLAVTGSTITANSATGGAAGSGGRAGQGIGGGVYFADDGSVCLDVFTKRHISDNTASTSNNDVFGVFTVC